MLATEEIGQNETMIEVPSHMIISSKKAYFSEIHHIIVENPQIFGKHIPYAEDNLLNAFILYELGKGEKSFWAPMFDIWPKDTDILMNWDDEDIEWL